MRPAPPVVAKGSKSKEEPFAVQRRGPGPAPRRGRRGPSRRRRTARRKELGREREERPRRKALRGRGVVRMVQADCATSPAIALIVLCAGSGGRASRFRARRRRTLSGTNKSSFEKGRQRAERKVVEQGLAKLNQGELHRRPRSNSCGGTADRRATGRRRVKAFFVLAASELKIEYGRSAATGTRPGACWRR